MRLTIPLAILLLLAGCSAPAGGPTDTTTPESAATTPTDATAANTVAYDDLSAEARSAFAAAADGTARFVPDSPYVEGDAYDADAADVFADHAYVVRDGTYYAVSLEPDGYVASYHIQTEPATVGQNDSAVAVEDLSPDVRDEVRSAVENGSHAVPPGKWSSQPPALEDHEYVRYEGETYRLMAIHGDHPTYELTVRRVG